MDPEVLAHYSEYPILAVFVGFIIWFMRRQDKKDTDRDIQWQEFMKVYAQSHADALVAFSEKMSMSLDKLSDTVGKNTTMTDGILTKVLNRGDD